MANHGFTHESARFGGYLRRIREDRKYSLDSVAELSTGFPERITKSHLSRIENGQALPTIPRLFTLSQIYGVSVSSLAERFEIEFKREMVPQNIEGKTTAQVLVEAKKLRLSGLHDRALWLYEGLLERCRAGGVDQTTAAELLRLRLHRVNCLLKLERYTAAKDEVEDVLDVLNDDGLDSRLGLVALQYLAMCCSRLGKFTVALMALEQATRELGDGTPDKSLQAELKALEGHISVRVGRYAPAIDCLTSAIKLFDELDNSYEACITKINLVSALIARGNLTAAKRHAVELIREAKSHGYDRIVCIALSQSSEIAFKDGNMTQAESLALQSNVIARPREYASVLFRNCFYLWSIARRRTDRESERLNEKTLRKYFSRIDDTTVERTMFKEHLTGGGS